MVLGGGMMHWLVDDEGGMVGGLGLVDEGGSMVSGRTATTDEEFIGEGCGCGCVSSDGGSVSSVWFA